MNFLGIFASLHNSTDRSEAHRPRGTGMLMMAIGAIAFALLPCASLHAQGTSSGSGAVRTNPGFVANSIPRNDDGSTSRAIPLGFNINFFGQVFSEAWVNNNGNITFGGPLSTFTPEGLRASPLRIIAPFWADVDTRGTGSALVTYGTDTVNGHPAFGVNWVDVGYFASHDDKLNSFQLVLIERSDLGAGNFDIEFNYNRILWETGDASGGSGGFGGVPASAGYSNGTGKPEGSFEILGSRQRGLFLDSSRFGLTKRTLNSNIRGRLVFFVRNGSVDCTFSILSIDEPFPWQGGTGTVQVAAPADCAWTAVSNSSFITIVGDANRNGSGDVQYIVAENRRSARAGTLTVAGETVRVLQDGFITLSVTPSSISVSPVDGRIPSQVALRVEAVRDPVNYVASVAIIDGSSNWRLSLTPNSGNVTATQPDILFLNVSPGFGPLVAGLAEITVTDVEFGLSIKIPVVLGASQLGPRVEVSQSSFVFNAVQGAAAPPSQGLLVLNAGTGSLNWNISSEALAAAPWLRVSGTSGTATSGSLLPAVTTISVDQAGLAPGLYQTSLPITSAQALNNPQTVTITLNVAAPDAASAAELTPRGMVFIGQQGLNQPRPQTLSVSNRGAGPLTYSLQATTENGVNWLVLSQTAGNATAGPSNVQVGVNTSRLSAGLYRGNITASFSTGEVQIVDVVLALSAGAGQLFPGSGSCNRQALSMVTTTLGFGETIYSGFTQPIVTRIVDNCGNPVNDATIFVEAGPDTIVLRALGNGNYGGSWTPRSPNPAQTLLFTAFIGGTILQNSYTTVVYLAPGEPSLPIIDVSGVVEGAGLAAGWPLAPGGIISILGAGLANAEVTANTVPLPTELGGVRVQIGNQDVPLISVRPDMIRVQVPFNLLPGDSVSIRVINNGRVSAPQTMLVFPARPGILDTDGAVNAFDGNGNPITSLNPARPGGAVVIRAVGLGITEPLPATGAAAPPSSVVVNQVRVFVGGEEVPVSNAGLVPGLVGIYQVAFLLPSNVTTGPDVPVVIQQAGITSDSSSNVGIPIVRPE